MILLLQYTKSSDVPSSLVISCLLVIMKVESYGLRMKYSEIVTKNIVLHHSHFIEFLSKFATTFSQNSLVKVCSTFFIYTPFIPNAKSLFQRVNFSALFQNQLQYMYEITNTVLKLSKLMKLFLPNLKLESWLNIINAKFDAENLNWAGSDCFGEISFH